MNIYNQLVKLIEVLKTQSGLINLKTHTFYEKMVNSDSLIIDLGANVGQFAQEITSKFNCTCYAVEAISDLFNKIPTNEKIKKFNFAINDKDEILKIYISNNRECNSIDETIASEYGIKDIVNCKGLTFESFLKQEHINSIDLL